MRLVRIFGTDIRLNIFFLLLFVVYWYYGLLTHALVVFGVVFLHEMGHVVVGAGYGIKIPEIELLPFGGVARMDGNLELNPTIETYVALAGPLTNGFLTLGGYILHKFGMGNQQWLPFFIQCNITLGLFNLIPAFPLDGGRILRALASRKYGLKTATEHSVNLSKAIGFMAAGLGAWLLYFRGAAYFNWLVIAGFLIYAAVKEQGTAMFLFMKFLTRKKEELLREGLLLARQVVALETLRLKEVVKYFVPRKYHLVVVVGRDQRIKGTVTEAEVIEKLMQGGLETPVGALLQTKK
jgi:stage IV sporulation protein FB